MLQRSDELRGYLVSSQHCLNVTGPYEILLLRHQDMRARLLQCVHEELDLSYIMFL